MRFGKIDVTEAQVCVMLIMFLSAYPGPWIWNVEVSQEKKWLFKKQQLMLLL